MYDCGSTRPRQVNGLVSDYKKMLRPFKIDLLVLSHLHSDHTSGLNTLLSRYPGVPVDLAVLPYLSPLERLIVSLSKEYLPNWYYEFLSDPATFLVSKGVRKIILIGDSEPSEVWDNLPKDRPNLDHFGNEEGPIEKISLQNARALEENIRHEEPLLTQMLNSGAISAKTHDGGIFARTRNLRWLFQFYNYKVERTAEKEKFEKSVSAIIGTDKITEVIKDFSKRKLLRDCYKSLQADFNDTSLLMYHGPIFSDIHLEKSFHQAHLLTGDLNLNNKVLDVCSHFGNDLSKVGFCLVPHHGSKKNWDPSFSNNFRADCEWVVSCGLRNKHHPSFQVVDNLKKKGKHVVLCNEITGLVCYPLTGYAHML